MSRRLLTGTCGWSMRNTLFFKYSRGTCLLSKTLHAGIPDTPDVFCRPETCRNHSEPGNYLHNMRYLHSVDNLIPGLQRGSDCAKSPDVPVRHVFRVESGPQGLCVPESGGGAPCLSVTDGIAEELKHYDEYDRTRVQEHGF